MAERLDPIIPQVPIEGIAIHIGKAGLCMGDEASAKLMSDGRVGIYARVQKRFLGIFPRKTTRYLGHLGPVTTQVLAPALAQDIPLRLRVVVLTPEHLATSGPPEIHVSVWGDRRQLAPFLELDGFSFPADPFATAERYGGEGSQSAANDQPSFEPPAAFTGAAPESTNGAAAFRPLAADADAQGHSAEALHPGQADAGAAQALASTALDQQGAPSGAARATSGAHEGKAGDEQGLSAEISASERLTAAIKERIAAHHSRIASAAAERAAAASAPSGTPSNPGPAAPARKDPNARGHAKDDQLAPA